MYEVGPDEFSERWAPSVIGILRIVTALLFFEHGTAKLLGFPATTMAHPAMWSLPWIAGWFELIGGFLLLIGLFTRWVSLLLAGEMAVAYWYIHAANGFYPINNGGEGAILYCFIFLTLFVIGAGEFSIDKIIARKASPIQGYAAPGGERALADPDE